MTVERDGIERNGRALIDALKFTVIGSSRGFRHSHNNAKLLIARLKRTVPRTIKPLRRGLGN